MLRKIAIAATVACTVLSAFAPPHAAAGDWPMFRYDREFSSHNKEKIKLPLAPVWVYRTRQYQHPEWLKGNRGFEHSVERARYEVSISSGGDAVFVTSKADGRILCLEAESGKLRWERVTGGGVNRPPTYFDGKVYAGSDDGHVYCIDAKTGKDVWVYKVAPANRWLFSYNQMMSVWTVRTNVMIDKGVAYFGCGVMPHDGTFITALDPKTGKQIWKNDTHSETRFRWAVSPHGNIYATETNLYIPNDAKPFRWIEHNAFRRSDGRHMDWGGGDPRNPGRHGGKDFDPLKDGAPAMPGYGSDVGSIQGTPKRRYAPLIYNPDLCSAISTDGAVFSVGYGGGSNGYVGGAVFAHVGGKSVWSSKISEWPNQVIAANGRIFVSTRDGTVYGYAPQGAKNYGVIDEPVEAGPFVKGPSLAKAAEAIIKRSGVVDGYALVLDCTTGELARELATRTKLHISAVFDDEEQAVAARKAISDANLHVSRIIVWTRAPGEPLPFPPRYASLVTSEAAAYGNGLPKTLDGLDRLLKPVRGKAVIGGKQKESALTDWIKWTGQGGWAIDGADGSRWALRTGPRLKGAGAWTTAAGDAGHTMCSNDEVLKPPLGCVWIGRPFVPKGSRGTSPSIMADGVFLHQVTSASNPGGHIEGYDQYTGRRLWRNNGGVTDTVGANGALILRYTKFLIQLDPWTGKIVKNIKPPFMGGDWTKMAMDRNGTTLYLAATGLGADKQRWSCVLAYDVPSGNVIWSVGGPGEKRQWGGWNCISDGRIYDVGGAPNAEELAQCKADMLAVLKKLPEPEYRVLENNINTSHTFRMLTAHDAKTGKFLYRKPVDITNAGGGWTVHVTGYTGRRDRGYHPHIRPAVIANGGVVIFCTEGAADKCWRVWPGGGYKGRALSVYDGATGKLLWYRYGNYRARPVVTNEYIYAEPWGFNIRTGEPRSRLHPVTGKPGAKFVYYRWDKQCGTIAGSKYFLFGRASGVAYQDLYSDQGLYTIFHSRSSCWIDTSSSGGTMIKPPYAISCQCEVSMPFTFAMGTVPTPVALSQYFCQPGPALPVKHLYLDFGCTGDRRDKKGRLWVMPRSRSGMELGLQYSVGIEGGQEVRRSAVHTPIGNAEVASFVFATCVEGMSECTMPISEDPKGKKYKVRLGFSALPGDKKGERVFDVFLNGKVVLKDFDIIKETGKADRAVWKDVDVTLGHELVLQLGGKDGSKRPPLINAIQVLRQE